jgi:DnaK suppressor protein
MGIKRDSKELPDEYNPIADDEYMSPNMLTYFERKLEYLKKEILDKEENIRSEIAYMPGREPDHVDQGINEEIRHQDIAFYDHEEDMLRQVDEALARIKTGDYGFCYETGEPIGVKRLEVAPWAKYSIEVQEQIEKEAV